MAGNLYLIATPIGNLSDITLRAINVLKNVDIIAAEDTRQALKLLNHLEIKKELISYYKQTEKIKSNILISKLLEGKDIAIVSDAGTPGISDPGSEIVKQAIENNIQIIPIPGPCAAISAIIASGMDTKEFCFIGFLPVNEKERKLKLEEIKYYKQTIIFYEAPHKLKNTLKSLLDFFGNRNIVLARELTKIHEEFIRTNLKDVLDEIKEPRGEYVIILEGSNINKKELEINNLNKMTLEEHFNYYKNQGLDKKEIIKKIAKDREINKNEIYQYFLKY